VQATVELTPDRGWHLYGPERGDAGAPPTITWNLPHFVHAGGISYPPSTRVTSRGLTTHEYHDRTPLRVALAASGGADRETRSLACRRELARLLERVRTRSCEAHRSTRRDAQHGQRSRGGAHRAGSCVSRRCDPQLDAMRLPVLSFKALRAIGEPPSARVRSALAYAAGVTASCATLGGILLAVRAAGTAVGWGFQLQSPPFVAFLSVLLLVLALAMSGAIELTIPVPQRLARGVATAGAFGDGVLVTLIASACIAPYMGAALAYALSAATPRRQSASLLRLGSGSRLPHVVLMTVPALLRRLPKPGAWMVTARRVLSVPLYLTVVWLVWVFVQQVAPVGSAGTAQAANDGAFSSARLATLRGEHRPVLVTIGAAWCITCKANERFALDRAEVTKHLRDRHVAVLRGDWTSQDPNITAYLHSLGAAGVPLYVYYAPGRPRTSCRSY